MPRCCRPWAWRRRLGALLGRGQCAVSGAQQRASDVAGGLGALSKVLRMLLQSAVLGVGAYLVIDAGDRPGIIIASLDPDLARAGAGRTRDRQLEGLRRGPPGLGRL